MLWHFVYQQAMKFHLGPPGHSYLSWRSIYLRVPPTLPPTSLTSMLTYTMLFWQCRAAQDRTSTESPSFSNKQHIPSGKKPEHQWRFTKTNKTPGRKRKGNTLSKWAQNIAFPWLSLRIIKLGGTLGTRLYPWCSSNQSNFMQKIIKSIGILMLWKDRSWLMSWKTTLLTTRKWRYTDIKSA